MKRILAILLLTLCALPLVAQSMHPIAKIEFRGTKIPTQILLSESTLSENRNFSDEELQRAVYRIKRLPYVFDARYTLEGTTLVVEVKDMHRLFYAANAIGARIEGNTDGTAGLDSGVGGRLFLQQGGVLEANGGTSVINNTENSNIASVQYTQHAIGGTRLFAQIGVGLRDPFGREDRQVLPHVTIGYPLDVNQTVSLTALQERFSFSQNFSILPRPLNNFGRSDALQLQWRFDTTDDPFYFLRGAAVDVAPRYIRERSHFEGFSQTTIFPSDERGHTTELAIDGRRLLPLGTRNALFGDVGGSWSRRNVDATSGGFVAPDLSTVKEGRLGIGWAHNFFDLGGPERLTRSRIEANISYARTSIARTPRDFEINAWEYGFAYVFRHPWGTVRASVAISTR